MVTNFTIFILLTTMPLVLSILIAKNSNARKVYYRLGYTAKGRTIAAGLLCFALIAFHVDYNAIFSLTTAGCISSLYVFFSAALNYNIRFMQFINSSMTNIYICSLVCIVLCFIPALFPVAFTMALILMTVFCFPHINNTETTVTVKCLPSPDNSLMNNTTIK